MKYVVAIAILVPLVVGFILVWKKNHATPIPEDAFVSPPSCGGCNNKSCGNYKEEKE